MLDRAKLKKFLTVKYVKEFKKRDFKNASKVIFETFNYPYDLSSDFMTLKKPLNAATDYELFILLYGTDKDKLNDFFTTEEIEKYSKQDFKMEMMPESFSFDAIEIVPDQQWISCISTKELIQLRDNQKINYNENTQRSLRHVTFEGNDYYEISLNNKAVESIMKYMQDGVYIPNTITFNIPEDAEFEYSKKTKELRFNKIDMFDILDGYHRYIAISRCYTLDKSFDCPMELRFVKFRESKANHFIFQEDQKTRMKKIDSDSLNQYDYANQIVQKLNEESNLAGLINKNDSIINAPLMSYMIKLLYFPKKKNVNENRSSVITISKELKEKINEITEKNVDLLNKPWDEKYLFLFLLASREYQNYDINIIQDKINQVYTQVEVTNIKYRKIPTKYIENIVKQMKGGE